MKKLLLLFFTPLLFAGCGNGFENGFEMQYIQDFQIFSGLNPLQTHVFEFNNIDTQRDFFFDNNSTTVNKVVSILPKSFRLTALGGNLNFDILERARINIIMEDGTLESEVAFREPVPLDAGFELDLLPTLADVEEHLEGERFSIKIKLNFREIPNQSIDVRLDYRFQAILEE